MISDVLNAWILRKTRAHATTSQRTLANAANELLGNKVSHMSLHLDHFTLLQTILEILG